METANEVNSITNPITTFEDLIGNFVAKTWSCNHVTDLHRVGNDRAHLKRLSKHLRVKLGSCEDFPMTKDELKTKFFLTENIKFGKGYRINVLKVLVFDRAETPNLLFMGLFLAIVEKRYKELFPFSYFFYRGDSRIKPAVINILKNMFDTSMSPYQLTTASLYYFLTILYQTNFVTQSSFIFMYDLPFDSYAEITIPYEELRRIRTKINKAKYLSDINGSMLTLRSKIELTLRQNLEIDITGLPLMHIKSTCFYISSITHTIKCNSGEFFASFLNFLKATQMEPLLAEDE